MIAAEVGQLELAHDYLGEAALIDLRDLAHNTRDGLHMASLAGTWQALVAGFGGMRAGTGPHMTFAPRLPGGLTRLSFRIRYRGRCLRVTVAGPAATYELVEGEPITIGHHGELFDLGTEPVTKAGAADLGRTAAEATPPPRTAAATPARRLS